VISGVDFCPMRTVSRAVRNIAFALFTFFIVGSFYATGESQKSLENDLRKIYEHKLLSLRNPYFGKSLNFDSSGIAINHLIEGPWSTCGLLEVQKIRINSNGVEIDGKRVILALRSADVDQQQTMPHKVQVAPVLTNEDVRIRLQMSTVDVKQVNEIMAKLFQGGQLLDRVYAYWKPLTNDLKAFRLNTPNASIGELEGSRPVYLVITGLVQPPKGIRMPNPEYTDAARGKRLEGTTLLSVVVNEKGFPEMLEIVRGLGEGLDIQALLAVANWRFEPAVRDGKAIAVMVNVEVTFKLG
jgi:TonB family protein